jgi:hypothetical protein
MDHRTDQLIRDATAALGRGIRSAARVITRGVIIGTLAALLLLAGAAIMAGAHMVRPLNLSVECFAPDQPAEL